MQIGDKLLRFSKNKEDIYDKENNTKVFINFSYSKFVWVYKM